MKRKLFYSEARAETFARRLARFTRRHVVFIQYVGRGVFSVDFC